MPFREVVGTGQAGQGITARRYIGCSRSSLGELPATFVLQLCAEAEIVLGCYVSPTRGVELRLTWFRRGQPDGSEHAFQRSGVRTRSVYT